MPSIIPVVPREYFIMSNGKALAICVGRNVFFTDEALLKTAGQKVDHNSIVDYNSIDVTTIGGKREYIKGLPICCSLDVSFACSGIRMYDNISHKKLCKMLGFGEGTTIEQVLRKNTGRMLDV